MRYVGRPERASPAEGAADLHSSEQARIVAEAFADPPDARPTFLEERGTC